MHIIKKGPLLVIATLSWQIRFKDGSKPGLLQE